MNNRNITTPAAAGSITPGKSGYSTGQNSKASGQNKSTTGPRRLAVGTADRKESYLTDKDGGRRVTNGAIV